MARLVFAPSDQISFFQRIKASSKLNNSAIAKEVGISDRSFRDWITGHTLPRQKETELLAEKFNIKLPPIIEIREENWSGRMYGSKAARRKMMLYGPPGTPDGRSKGGQISQQKRHEDPEKYRQQGCTVPNIFSVPNKNEELAEFIGIVLGDGGLTQSQCQITLHKHDDREYARHVVRLIHSLFSYNAPIVSKSRNAIVIVITGVKFTQMMVGFGLTIGNKVAHQVSIPNWILTKRKLFLACQRGLFDTDGGTVIHKHKIKHQEYSHFNLCFSNASKPLLQSFWKGVLMNHIQAYINKHCVMIYNAKDIKKFFEAYQPNNPKHKLRYLNFLEECESGQIDTPGKRGPV